MTVVDLRSDTVTRPTPAMRRAMAEAEVGDDVYGEDPTVRRLEEETAELLGKEAAVFVPSGTMANQISLSLLAGPGSEVLVHTGSHVLNYEAGAAAALWGITLRPLDGDRGRFLPEQIRAAIGPEDEHLAPVRAVAVENTHNRAGGAVWPLDDLDAVTRTATEAGLSIHLDGARLWNASAATGEPLARLARDADTVSVCFSKGLGAPVGSAVASTAERIRRGRVHRKRLGGGMRQAGIVAAGALHALAHHRKRLVEDHHRARRLGEFLSGAGVDVLPVDSNMVIVDLGNRGGNAYAVEEALAKEGLLLFAVSPTRLRMVVHLEIEDAHIDRAIEVLGAVLETR